MNLYNYLFYLRHLLYFNSFSFIELDLYLIYFCKFLFFLFYFDILYIAYFSKFLCNFHNFFIGTNH